MRVGPKGPVGAESAGEPVNPRLRAVSQRVEEASKRALGHIPQKRNFTPRTTDPRVERAARDHGFVTKRGKQST